MEQRIAWCGVPVGVAQRWRCRGVGVGVGVGVDAPVRQSTKAAPSINPLSMLSKKPKCNHTIPGYGSGACAELAHEDTPTQQEVSYRFCRQRQDFLPGTAATRVAERARIRGMTTTPSAPVQ
jgi:hypothetical protein